MGLSRGTEETAGSDCILVTGGAGFIGSNFVLDWLAGGGGRVVNLDKLTYAGNPANLASVQHSPAYTFVHGDICDAALVTELLREHRPRAVVHFAAESHVDRSIVGPEAFLRTNIDGTFTLLQAARGFYDSLTGEERERFRFLHVSTDEVYGTLEPQDPAFHEETPYAPNSPYAASKAASDHLVRAWVHTYGLPAVVTTLCALLDELVPESKFRPHKQLVKFVTDRPGHDRRYAIDARKLEGELGWRAQESFETGLRKTVEWYLANAAWVESVTSGAYQQWMSQNYDGREVPQNEMKAGVVVGSGEGSR